MEGALTIYDELNGGGKAMQPFQLLPKLSTTDRQRLKDSIEREGLLEPVVRDAVTGVVVDGHHREEIAKELGIEVRYRDVMFKDDSAREAYALAINLVRRRLSDRQYGEMFQKIVELRGGRFGQGSGNQHTTASGTVPEAEQVAKEQGIHIDTARRRMALARELDSYPEMGRQFDRAQETAAGKKTVPQKWVKEVAKDKTLAARVEAGHVTLVSAIKTLKDNEAQAKKEKEEQERREREEARREEQVESGEVSPTADELIDDDEAPELPKRPVSTEADKTPERLATTNGQLSRVAASDVAQVPRNIDDVRMALEVVGGLEGWLADYRIALEKRLKPRELKEAQDD